MVDTRKSSVGSREEAKVQATEPVEADTIHLYSIQLLCKAIVRLRRTFSESEISDDDAKRVLHCCNLDVKKAVEIIKSRVPIVVGDEVSGAPSGDAMASVKRDGNPLKRKTADFLYEIYPSLMVNADGLKYSSQWDGSYPRPKRPLLKTDL